MDEFGHKRAHGRREAFQDCAVNVPVDVFNCRVRPRVFFLKIRSNVLCAIGGADGLWQGAGDGEVVEIGLS